MKPIHKSMSYFRSFDLFGIKPSLYFKGRKKSGTNFGLCLTMLMLIFTSLCFGFFGQDLYYRLNPQLRYNEEYDPFPEGITLDPEYNPILIETNSPAVDMFYTDPTLVNVKVSQFTMKQQVNAAPIVTIEDYQMEICDKEIFPQYEPKRLFLHSEKYKKPYNVGFFRSNNIPNYQIHYFILQQFEHWKLM